jgi:hypothetical protein
MAGVEGLDLRLDAKLGHHAAHGAQHARRVGHDVIGLGEIHRAAIERADFRQAFADMCFMRSLAPAMSVPTGLSGSGFSVESEYHVAAHAGGQVQDHIDLGLADALGHFAVEIATSRAGCRFRDRGHGNARSRRRPWRHRSRLAICCGRARHMRAAVLRGRPIR